jgi:hypothetical protein
VASCQQTQFADDIVCLRHQHPVAPDQIRVVVNQPCRPAIEAPGSVEIEEDRTAAEEWFDVAGEPARVVSTERREQLPFAAGPLQQRTSGNRRGDARMHDIIIGVLAADT